MAQRRDKENYYLDIADSVSERSTCLRRRYGASRSRFHDDCYCLRRIHAHIPGRRLRMAHRHEYRAAGPQQRL